MRLDSSAGLDHTAVASRQRALAGPCEMASDAFPSATRGGHASGPKAVVAGQRSGAAARGNVREWMERKARHVESPLLAVQGGAKASRVAGVRAEAHIGGAILAQSDCAQIVNQRLYFPIEDCCTRLLRDSPKRWR